MTWRTELAGAVGLGVFLVLEGAARLGVRLHRRWSRKRSLHARVDKE